jgi:hypothetical protein
LERGLEEIRTLAWRESVAEILNSRHGRNKNKRRFFVVVCPRKEEDIFGRAHAPGFHFFGRVPHAWILGIDRLNPADTNNGLLTSVGKSTIIGIGYCYQVIQIIDLRCYGKSFF